jgi:hypothetical protein
MMRVPTKYAALILGTLVLFVYLLSTEGADRIISAANAYRQWQNERELSLSHDQIQAEQVALLQREEDLGQKHIDSLKAYPANEIGAIDYITARTASSGVAITQMVPSFHDGEDGVRMVEFTLTLRGGYHDVGRFVNAIETGQFPCRISHLAIEKEEQSRSIKTVIEGSVTLEETSHLGG